MKQGDVVRWHDPEQRRKIVAIIYRWNGHPDSALRLLDKDANPYRAYAANCEEAVVEGDGEPVFADGERAWQLAAQLGPVVRSKAGVAAIAAARGKPDRVASVSKNGTVGRSRPATDGEYRDTLGRIIEPGGGGGGLNTCDEPYSLVQRTGKHVELSGHMMRRLSQEEDRLRLLRELDPFDTRYRPVLVYALEMEMKAPVIGRLMGLSPGHVRVLKHRAFAALRKILEREGTALSRLQSDAS